jgi:hypothetical protein
MKRLVPCLLLLALAAPALAVPDEAAEIARALPIQDGGRVKPLDTFARFTLLRLHGRQSIGGRSATAWLLDTMLRPDDAMKEPLFLVQNDEALEAAGLRVAGKRKRDRYAYEDFAPALPRLMQLAHEYAAIDEKDRSSVQQQIVNLAQNVATYHGLLAQLESARAMVPVGDSPTLRAFFPDAEAVHLSTIFASGPRLRATYDGNAVNPRPGGIPGCSCGIYQRRASAPRNQL